MAKTSAEVCTMALQMIGVTPADDVPEASDMAMAQSHLAGVYETLTAEMALALEWTVETVPQGVFLPLSRAVAGSMATVFQRDQYVPLYRAGIAGVRSAEFEKMRVRGVGEASYF